MQAPQSSVPAQYLGVWKRERLEEPTGTMIDSISQVYWLQTPWYFTDIRVPPARVPQPPMEAKSFTEYDNDIIKSLAIQKTFAGHTTVEGDVVTWHRAVDWHPCAPGDVDVGKCDFTDEMTLIEDGVHDDYREYWKRLDTGSEGQVAMTLAHEVLQDGSVVEGRHGYFLITGKYWSYVLNRRGSGSGDDGMNGVLPSDVSKLSEFLGKEERKPEQLQALQLLSCFGVRVIRKGCTDKFQVLHSTWPWLDNQPFFGGRGQARQRFTLNQDGSEVVEVCDGNGGGDDDGQGSGSSKVAKRVWRVHSWDFNPFAES